MPGDHTYATLASPVREAMAEALVERAVSAIEAFLAEQAPVRYELMRRSDRWNGNWITHAIASGDPDAYLARFGKHVWMIDQLQLGDARPDDARLRRLYEDPAGAYGRWRLECGLDPVDVLGGPGKGLSWPGMHAEAFADDVCLYDELAARHPGFCAAAGDLLPGRMSWLRVFVEGGHAFSERDLQGLAVALTTIDDAVSLTYANDFRGKPPAEGPCVWDLAEEARLPLARARTTRIRMGRRPEESDRALLDNDRAALLGMAERIGIPEVLSFVAETIQSWDCFYRPAGPPGAVVPPSEHRHLDLAGEVLGHILAEMPGASP